MAGKEINFVPNFDLVVIKIDESPDKTSGGLIIPDQYRARTFKGTVVMVGPGLKNEPMNVVINDRVSYPDFAGTEIYIDGEEYMIAKQSQLVVHGKAD